MARLALERVRVQFDAIDTTGDVLFYFCQFPHAMLNVNREHVVRSSVLSTMASSADARETSFTAPQGYLQAWLELIQGDALQLLKMKDLDSLLVLLKVYVP